MSEFPVPKAQPSDSREETHFGCSPISEGLNVDQLVTWNNKWTLIRWVLRHHCPDHFGNHCVYINLCVLVYTWCKSNIFSLMKWCLVLVLTLIINCYLSLTLSLMIHCVASCTISCTSSLFSPSQGITIGKMDDLINNICKLLLHFAESKLRFFHVRHLVIVFLKNCLFSHTVRVNEVDSSQSTNMIRKEYK